MRSDLLSQINRLRRERSGVVVVTRLADGAQRLVADGDDLAADPLAAAIAEARRSGRSQLAGEGEAAHFLTVHQPPPRLVVIGAVHITQAIAAMAPVLDLDLTVIDPRTAFATPERFAGTDLRADWPQTVLPGLGLDRYTALAAVTHDPKIDDPALTLALRAGCFYVGALGSRKTHARRRERLLADGLDEATLARIEAPIGVAIGAASPAEIALSILASVVAALRRPAGATP